MVLSLWTPVRIGSLELPAFQSDDSVWQVSTKATAGGFAYFLPEAERAALSAVTLSWSWRVDRFPTARGDSPEKKAADDYALRVGVLILGDGEAKLSAEFKDATRNLGAKISYVVFYSATDKKDWAGKCFPNPYSERVINCLRMAKQDFSEVLAHPLLDLESVIPISLETRAKLRSAGVWIFADSDNSKTETVASLRGLKFGTDGKLK